MLPSRRKEFIQWVCGVTFTVSTILALAYWLEGGWGSARPVPHDADHAEAPAQPRVPASNSSTP